MVVVAASSFGFVTVVPALGFGFDSDFDFVGFVLRFIEVCFSFCGVQSDATATAGLLPLSVARVFEKAGTLHLLLLLLLGAAADTSSPSVARRHTRMSRSEQ